MNQDLYESVRRLFGALTRGLSARQGDGVAEVLERLAAQDLGAAAFHEPEPQKIPVVQYLPQCLAEATRLDAELAAGIAAVEDALQWRRSPSYTDHVLGTGFNANYGWAQFIGPHGFFPGDDFLLGLLMLGPDRHYPDHYHPAPELYWPLTTESFWSRDSKPFEAKPQGAIIWHAPTVLHATITGTRPLLAVWCWTTATATPARLKWA